MVLCDTGAPVPTSLNRYLSTSYSAVEIVQEFCFPETCVDSVANMTPEQREKLILDSKGTNIPQDYLGNLNEKTISELQELLDRQQKLLKNVKFLERLPDKGQKIKNMAARLESVIKSRKEVDATTDLFEKMALSAAEARRVPPLHDDSEMDLLKMMANRSEGKIYVDERTELKETNSTKFVNSYDRVIRQAEKKMQKASSKFFPHRSIKHKDVSELPLESLAKLAIGDQPSEPSKKTPTKLTTNSDHGKDAKDNENNEKSNPCVSVSKSGESTLSGESPKTKERSLSSVDKKETLSGTVTPERRTSVKHKNVYDESLVAADRWHSPDHGPIKMISIEESISVLEKQKATQEALKAQQAAEKLAQRLHINMASFDPEGSRNLVYRNPTNADSDGEDSDDVEEDYPEGVGE